MSTAGLRALDGSPEDRLGDSRSEAEVQRELDALEPSDAVRTAFERQRPGTAGHPDH